MRITRCTLLGLTLLLVACGEGGVDWNAPENLVLREKSAKVGEGGQPDGKRCLVRSRFLVKEGQGMAQSVPIGVLAAGTKDAFLAAAQGVKKRAAGGTPG